MARYLRTGDGPSALASACSEILGKKCQKGVKKKACRKAPKKGVKTNVTKSRFTTVSVKLNARFDQMKYEEGIDLESKWESWMSSSEALGSEECKSVSKCVP